MPNTIALNSIPSFANNHDPVASTANSVEINSRPIELKVKPALNPQRYHPSVKAAVEKNKVIVILS